MTGPLYQPFAFGAVVGAPISVGAVSSMLMPLTVVGRGVAGEVDRGTGDRLVRALGEVTGAVQPAIAMPEPESVQMNETVTSVLFQPAPFGGGRLRTDDAGRDRVDAHDDRRRRRVAGAVGHAARRPS